MNNFENFIKRVLNIKNYLWENLRVELPADTKLKSHRNIKKQNICKTMNRKKGR